MLSIEYVALVRLTKEEQDQRRGRNRLLNVYVCISRTRKLDLRSLGSKSSWRENV